MKKITFLISVLVILAVGVKAQDVGVSDILTPAGDTTIAVGSSLPLTVVLTNYGPASVVEGTTVTMAMYIDGTNAGGGTVTVPAGMTIAATESVMMPFNPIDLSTLPAGTYEFCVGTDGTSLGADPVATNNKHCFQLTVGTASVQENSLNSFVAYPNPANDLINVVSPVAFETVRLFDMTGREVYSFNAKTTTHAINVSSFETGMYFLVLESNNTTSTKKISIAR